MRGNRYGEVVAAAFVLGGATGYLIGLLTAPASGEPSRGEVPAGRPAAGVGRRTEGARPKLRLAVSG